MFEASEGVRTAEDFYRAAMLFQHGTEASDWRKARELALRAVELHPEYREAKWLAAAALDRELVRTGKRQRYGTQYRDVGGGWSSNRWIPQRRTSSERSGGCHRCEKLRRRQRR